MVEARFWLVLAAVRRSHVGWLWMVQRIRAGKQATRGEDAEGEDEWQTGRQRYNGLGDIN